MKIYINLFVLLIINILNLTANDTLTTKTTQNLNINDYNIYYDSRNQIDATINILNKFSDNFNYFSFTNFTSDSQSPEQLNFYTEHNLRYKVIYDIPIEFTQQFVIASGDKNDKLHTGLRFNLHKVDFLKSIFQYINFEYNINPQIITITNYNPTEYFSQIEHVFKFDLKDIIYNGDIYISGFADQNLNTKPNNKWVIEAQFGAEIYNNFYFVTEYRHNDFIINKSTPIKSLQNGIAIGFEYKVVSFSK